MNRQVLGVVEEIGEKDTWRLLGEEMEKAEQIARQEEKWPFRGFGV